MHISVFCAVGILYLLVHIHILLNIPILLHYTQRLLLWFGYFNSLFVLALSEQSEYIYLITLPTKKLTHYLNTFIAKTLYTYETFSYTYLRNRRLLFIDDRYIHIIFTSNTVRKETIISQARPNLLRAIGKQMKVCFYQSEILSRGMVKLQLG